MIKNNNNIKRPIISKNYSLTEYIGQETNNYKTNLYLAYIPNYNSYILITEKNKDLYFKSLEITCNPNDFYLNYEKQENYEDLENEIKTILKPYEIKLTQKQKEGGKPANSEIENLVLDIIDTLIENLSNLYNNNHFTRLENYSKPMKKFILDPVTTYNRYLTKNNEINEKKLKKEIEKLFFEIQTKANKNGFNFISEKWFNNEIINLINQTTTDPFLNLKLGYKSKYFQSEASELIVDELGLKRHLKGNTEDYYLYNPNLKYFDKVNTPKLKNKLYKTLGFNLVENDINNIIKSVSTEDRMYKNLLVFKNIYFDTDTLSEFKPNPETNTYNRQNYLTVNNIGSLDTKDETIKLVNYDKTLKLEDILTIKPIPEINPDTPVSEYKNKYGMTLTEIILRQILIPKDNPNDIRGFKDYLERMGSNIYGKNLYKTITFYYGDGDNGKSILNLFNNLIFNKLNYEINPDTLKDGFNLKNFDNRLCITIDEVTEDSFNDLKDIFKQMSSKYSKREERLMYTTDTFTLMGYPNLTIYANVLLNLNPVVDGAIFSRIDYRKLPNKFLDEVEIKNFNNAYPVINKLEEKLENDIEGLSWLSTAIILCLKHMKETSNRYTLKQSREETIDIFLNVDYLTKFLMLYIEFSDEISKVDYISNDEILNGFVSYMETKNKKVDIEGLAKTIGIKLNEIFPKLKNKGNKIKKNGRARYKLRLKSLDEVKKEYNQVYNINEDITGDELYPLDYNMTYKLVYDNIKKGNSTLSILKDTLPTIDCLDIVKQLESLNLIYNTGNLALDMENYEK